MRDMMDGGRGSPRFSQITSSNSAFHELLFTLDDHTFDIIIK